MTPVSREEMYLYKLAGGSVTVPTPVSRKEMYLAKACGESVTVPTPVSREEMYLYKLAGGSIALPTPVSRLELLMVAACGEAVVPYDPVSRLEWFWSQIVSPTQTITSVPPITFTSDGTPLSSCIIYGNGSQTGTPTSDAPIDPTFCGALSGADWTIPIANAGQTVPVYLGQTQTVRRIKKLVLDGTEPNWTLRATFDNATAYAFSGLTDRSVSYTVAQSVCNHFPFLASYADQSDHFYQDANNIYFTSTQYRTLSDFITYLSQQYAAGTPVTVWYVLATPTTTIVNEPLCKIGTYADELHSADAGVTIQTVSGSNTLTIGTDLQPSSVSITGHISQ